MSILRVRFVVPASTALISATFMHYRVASCGQ
jgi:hypothetical protein